MHLKPIPCNCILMPTLFTGLGIMYFHSGPLTETAVPAVMVLVLAGVLYNVRLKFKEHLARTA